MSSAQSWNHTGFQKRDNARSRVANESAQSSAIPTEMRYERSTEFWNRTRHGTQALAERSQ